MVVWLKTAPESFGTDKIINKLILRLNVAVNCLILIRVQHGVIHQELPWIKPLITFHLHLHLFIVWPGTLTQARELWEYFGVGQYRKGEFIRYYTRSNMVNLIAFLKCHRKSSGCVPDLFLCHQDGNLVRVIAVINKFTAFQFRSAVVVTIASTTGMEHHCPSLAANATSRLPTEP